MKETRAEYLPIEKLRPFEGHPFKVTDNDNAWKGRVVTGQLWAGCGESCRGSDKEEEDEAGMAGPL